MDKNSLNVTFFSCENSIPILRQAVRLVTNNHISLKSWNYFFIYFYCVKSQWQ